MVNEDRYAELKDFLEASKSKVLMLHPWPRHTPASVVCVRACELPPF
ncbi:MAG: hypothetical protein ACJASC_002221 [Limimaricola cinnabarinus]|jgi:hypothetical protein